MRAPFSIPLLLVLAAVLWLRPGIVCAQQQEAKLMQRIDGDAKSLIAGKSKPFLGASKDFFGTKSFNGKAARVSDFYLPQKYTSKNFLTGAFRGNKGFWMGDFKFRTDAAATKDFAQGGKLFDTKTAPVKAAHESAKAYAATPYATKDSKFRGKAQDAFDARGPEAMAGPDAPGWRGAMGPMTIDQVRDLLNKNK